MLAELQKSIFQIPINSTDIIIKVGDLLLREIIPEDKMLAIKIAERVGDRSENFYKFAKGGGEVEELFWRATQTRFATPRVSLELAITRQNDSDKIIGFAIGLAASKEEQKDWLGKPAYVNLGYVVDPLYQRQKIAITATIGLSEFWFRLGYKSVSLTVHPNNISLIRCAEKIGLKCYGDMQISHYGDGQPRKVFTGTRRDLILKPGNSEIMNSTKICGLSLASQIGTRLSQQQIKDKK
ncbi:MAG: GNAT family N-acetyltransferase [Rickettsiales bacterium]|jgi:RimJ/RimL family protein N-acetyltransferase|nr:GNAT family N-acetyltransferase [Rickettsiales bacterium]